MNSKIYITIDGKEIVKNRPTMQDWYDSISAIRDEKTAEKEHIATAKGADWYFKQISDYFEIPLEELKEKGDMIEVTNAGKLVSDLMAECFVGGQVDAPVKNSKS